MTHAGLLHSDTCGSKSACDSPQLFAAYRVLHRPLMPRHSPCALCSLTIFWNYAFSNLRSVLFPLSRIDNLFEIVVFLPKTFVLRIKTFEFLYFSHQYFLCSIFKIPDIAFAISSSFLRNWPASDTSLLTLPVKEAELIGFLLPTFLFQKKSMVGTSGLEPPTSRLSGVRSNHLSYAPMLSDRQ